MENVGLHEYAHPQYGDEVKRLVQEVIDRGRRDVSTGLQDIKREFDIREDLMVKPAALNVNVDEKGIHPSIYGQQQQCEKERRHEDHHDKGVAHP